MAKNWEKPEYGFAGQNPDEEVLAVIHRHPIIFLSPGYKMLGLLILPWIVFVFTPGFTAPFSWTFIITTLWALWIGFNIYYIWINDTYVITDQRVVEVDQISLFRRETSEVPYDKVQEVGHEVVGIYHTMLKVGHVEVKTASQHKLVLEDVYDPYAIEQLIAKHIHHKQRP